MVEMRRRPLPVGWARDPFGRHPHRLFDAQRQLAAVSG